MKKLIKIVLKSLFTVITACLLAPFILMTILQTEIGQSFAISQIKQFLEKQLETTIDIGKIELAFPLTVKASGIRLGEKNTPLAHIQKITFSLSLIDLFESRIYLSSLSIDTLHLYQFPERPSKQALNPVAESQSGFSFSWPLAPFELVIKDFTLTDSTLTPLLNISSTFAKEAFTSFNCTGCIEFLPKSAWFYCRLNILAKEAHQGSKSIEIECKKNQVKVDAAAVQLPLLSFFSKDPSTDCLLIDGTLHADAAIPIWEESFWNDLSSKPLISLCLALHGSFSGTIPHMGPLSSLINIPIDGSATVQGSFTDHFATLSFISGQLSIQDTPFTNLKINTDVCFTEGKMAGECLGSFTYQEHNVASNAKWEFGANLVKFDDLTINYSNEVISGTLTFDISQSTLKGHLEGHQIQLSSLEKMIGQQMKGTSDIALHIDLPSVIEGKLSCKSASWMDFAAQELSGHALWKNPQNSYQIDVNLSAPEIKHPLIIGSPIDLQTQIDLERQSGQFHLQSKAQAFSIDAAGAWTSSDNAFIVSIESLQGLVFKEPFAIKNPFDFKMQQNGLFLTPFFATIGEGTLQGEGELNNSHMICNLKGALLKADWLSAFYPDIRFDGQWSFDAHIQENSLSSQSGIEVEFENIKVAEKAFSNIPPLNGKAQIQVKEDFLAINGYVEGFGPNPIKLSGTLPVAISLSSRQVAIDATKNLDLDLTAEGEIEPFIHLFFTDTSSLSGYIKTAINVSGPFTEPFFSGTLSLSDGQYESSISGGVFKQISAEAEIKHTTLTLKNLSALDSSSGSIQANGAMTLDVKQQFPFEVNLKLDKSQIVNLDYAYIAASGNLLLQGSLESAKLSGQLAIDLANISIPEELPTQIKTVDVTYINQQSQASAPAASSLHQQQWPLYLNIQLAVFKNLSIKGKGLISDWEGKLMLTGTATDPLLNGELKNVKGQYEFNGKFFKINEGSIQFSGPPAQKTSLNILASKEIDRIKAEVILRGPIKKPVLTFRSNPPMTQKEILSYILFNRGITDINPTQGAQLNQSIVTLSSGKDNTDFLSWLRATIGIDRVDISSPSNSTDTNAISLQVGKYISRGIYVTVNKSINADTNSVGVEASLNRHFKVKAEVSDDAQDKLLIEWKKDY